MKLQKPLWAEWGHTGCWGAFTGLQVAKGTGSVCTYGKQLPLQALHALAAQGNTDLTQDGLVCVASAADCFFLLWVFFGVWFLGQNGSITDGYRKIVCHSTAMLLIKLLKCLRPCKYERI